MIFIGFMVFRGFATTQAPEFKRKNILISKKSGNHFRKKLSSTISNALIVNASDKMASEITNELKLSLPNCNIAYTPSIFLAKAILKKKQFEIIIASPILPDGCITKLNESLNNLDYRPNIVVIGNLTIRLKNEISSCFVNKSCEYKSTKTTPYQSTKSKIDQKHERIKKLGSDIRNDLNNPLQEIVTMLFIAQTITSSDQNDGIKSALSAIERAANNMAQVVSELEGKIKREVV